MNAGEEPLRIFVRSADRDALTRAVASHGVPVADVVAGLLVYWLAAGAPWPLPVDAA